MKRKIFLFGFLFVFFLLPKNVLADYEAKFIATGTCDLRSNSTGNCFYKDTTFQELVNNVFWVDTGDPVTVLSSKAPVPAPTSGNGSECKTTFSYVNVNTRNKDYKGWLCTDNLHIAKISEELQKEFTEAGFPESYWESLAILKEAHPTWKFVAVQTNLEWKDVLENEKGSKSLIQSTSSSTQGYLSTKPEHYNWDTNTFKVYDGSNWHAANDATIAYYLDPRNFLIDMYVFQFEYLSFNEELQTLEAITNLLGNAYIGTFAQDFVDAGKKYNINAVFLAARSRQEIGTSTTPTKMVSGKEFTYTYQNPKTGKTETKTFSGYYNFFNIGATDGKGATDRGLFYATGYSSDLTSQSKTYGRPWNTPQSAIAGGANFLSSGYISVGQNTGYTQKWDIVGPSYYNHQYMTNIQAPTTEADKTFRTYASIGLLDFALEFHIPVYKNMPEEVSSLPPLGNPNNRLKKLTVDGTQVEGFASSKMDYQMVVEYEKENVSIGATPIVSAATVTGTGTVPLEVGDNKITVKVKAQNGDIQDYTITINRKEKVDEGEIVYPTVEEILKKAEVSTRNNYIVNLTLTTKASDFKEKILKASSTAKVTVKDGSKEKTSGNLITGDTVTITSGEETKSFTVVLYGDVSGDGQITILDLLKVQKYLLKTSNLTGAYKEAADVSKDGEVTILDLLKVQKHLLGTSYISQK